jgi:hypothetical protein
MSEGARRGARVAGDNCDGGGRGCRAHARCRVARAAILHEVPMRRIGLVILAASLVLAQRAVEAQRALREIGDARVEIRC